MKLIIEREAEELRMEIRRLQKILGDIVEIEADSDDGKDLLVSIKFCDGYVFRGTLEAQGCEEDE